MENAKFEQNIKLKSLKDSKRGSELDLGRFFLIGYEGSEEAEILVLAEEFRPAGFVFFKRNYPKSDPLLIKAVIEKSQDYARKYLGRDFIWAIDNEGGLVRRLPEPFFQLPPAEDLAKGDLAEIMFLAEKSGRELKDLGFNLNLAPVLDVSSGAESYIGSRSYGEDPLIVAQCARFFAEGFNKAGLLCCGKHFPGLGAAIIDPHEVLPGVEDDLSVIVDRHMLPFKTLGNFLSAIMTTHALYPGLDPNEPATFSKIVVNWLKDKLLFEGPVLSDDLEMGAITGNYGVGPASVSAFKAGHDLLLICRTASLIRESFSALAGAVARDEILPSRLLDAHKRMERLFLAVSCYEK